MRRGGKRKVRTRGLQYVARRRRGKKSWQGVSVREALRENQHHLFEKRKDNPRFNGFTTSGVQYVERGRSLPFDSPPVPPSAEQHA
jgi:hypothetical protein